MVNRAKCGYFLDEHGCSYVPVVWCMHSAFQLLPASENNRCFTPSRKERMTQAIPYEDYLVS